MKMLSLLLSGLILSLSITAQTFQNMGSFNSSGVPEYLDPVNETISSTLLTDLKIILPDGENLQAKNPNLYNKTMTAITLVESSDVYMAFVSEGADFQSSVGFYTYQGTPPSHPALLNTIEIVFPNVSDANSGGGLRQGNRVKLGSFPAGTSIGFFLISNSFKYGRVMNVGNDVFYTDPQYNPEFSDTQKKHAVMLFDQESNRFVLLFEDFNRSSKGCDHDFNDAVFVISTASKTALSTEGKPDVQTEKDFKQGKDQPIKQITICHYPPGNSGNPQTISIAETAWATHQAHGDQLGECAPIKTLPNKPAEPQLDGDWDLTGRKQMNTVQVTPDGINVKSNKSSKWFLYKRVDDRTFKDDKGNIYQFKNDAEGEWRSANGKTRIKLVKVSPSNIEEEKKIMICHYPPGNKNNPQQIEIAESAWPAHEAHGDVKGNCKESDNTPASEENKIMICHYPPGNKSNPQQIEIAESAWPAHEAHGDAKGNCKENEAPSTEKMITICHYPPGRRSNPQTITIPESAWKAHEAHGDSLGECK